ncbi:MAG: right-handed parallel beta-helix repeat-containing protein, partial [Candidatus Babeliales bacterium]|nr:right-handed parallel beta-helix repeat-containing protein [Candidatus Babeliales bacterium]
TPIAVGNSPVGIAITPDGATAYVTNLNDNTITPITIATNTPLAPISGFFNPFAIAIQSNVVSGSGNGILQNANTGRIVRTQVIGGTTGIEIANSTNFNSIEECEVSNCNNMGFSILTSGIVNVLECVAHYNTSHGFDLSSSTGKGLIKACVASQNGGCGFNDRSASLYRYVANAAEGNGATPAGGIDTNYCITGTGTTLTLPPGPTPYFQFPTNNTGIGFAPTYWNNITLQ